MFYIITKFNVPSFQMHYFSKATFQLKLIKIRLKFPVVGMEESFRRQWEENESLFLKQIWLHISFERYGDGRASAAGNSVAFVRIDPITAPSRSAFTHTVSYLLRNKSAL